jgi:cytochrome b involved in lipid metabolism
LLWSSGKDADDYFEDIGHSNDARSKLKSLLVGPLEIDPNKPRSEGKVKGAANSISSEGGGGLPITAIVVVLLAIVIYFVFAPK